MEENSLAPASTPARGERAIGRRSLLSGGAVAAVGAALYISHDTWGASETQARDSASLKPRSDQPVSALRFMTTEQAQDVESGRGEVDITAACQRALDASTKVLFPPGVYLVDADPRKCLKVRSGQMITLADGAVIKAKPNALAAYQVLSIENVRDVTVIGGAIVGERNSHPGDDGEHGMGVGIFNSANVVLRGVRIADCWGDGIYVGGRGFEGQSSQIRIENCRSENNRRQGLTISAVDGCVVAGGLFTGTNGRAPAAGIDIEPNHGRILGIKRPKAGVTRVSIIGAECSGNEGHGLSVSQVHTHDVEIRDLVAHRNGMSGISCGYPGSNIRIIGPDCRENIDHGVHIFGDPAYVTREFRVERPRCVANRRNGILISRNVKGFSVSGGTVADNGEHGIACDGTGGSICGDGVIEGVSISANSQAGPAKYDNVYIGPQCRRIRVERNMIASGTGARRPRFAINVAAGEDIVIVGNDLPSAVLRANVNGLGRPGVTWRDNRGVAARSPG